MPLNGYMEIPEEKFSFGLSPEMVGIAAADQVWLQYIIRTHPTWMRCVEFGTYYGMTAVLLALCMLARGGTAWTIDINPCCPIEILRLWPSNLRFLPGELLPADGTTNQDVATLLSDAVPTLIVMDGGNKSEEVKRYAPLVQPGSAFAVHDWGSEFQADAQVSLAATNDVLVACGGFLPLCVNEAERWNSYFRGWEKQ